MQKKGSKPSIPAPDLPLYCDFGCSHAAFAPKDAVGDCRKEQAVYCTLLKQFNNKNNRCIAATKTGYLKYK